MVLCRACRPRRHISRRTCVQQSIPPDTEEVGVFVYRNQRHCGDCGIRILLQGRSALPLQNPYLWCRQYIIDFHQPHCITLL